MTDVSKPLIKTYLTHTISDSSCFHCLLILKHMLLLFIVMGLFKNVGEGAVRATKKQSSNLILFKIL